MNINILKSLNLFVLLTISISGFSQNNQIIPITHKVVLRDIHKGTLTIDTLLLNSYKPVPKNIENFYLDARSVFCFDENADFSNPKILASASKNNIKLISGPLLGDLQKNSVTLWLRSNSSEQIIVKVLNSQDIKVKTYKKNNINPGQVTKIKLNKLSPDTNYKYIVYRDNVKVANGYFKTAPPLNKKGIYKIAFGSCFHKIGLHNPNLMNQIVKEKPEIMLLLGDSATDDRDANINMHRSDYLLRDVSPSWKRLAQNVPLYASWDDHDYMNNDMSGIPNGYTVKDLEALRSMWRENWNNPKNPGEGVYFSTRIGPVEIIMLDTRSCRDIQRRGKYGCFIGENQMIWLKKTLKKSNAPFKIISSGTMWSDDISDGKDSWGTWDTLARKDIFDFIEKENISGVLLISGDRHGARGINIPRGSGHIFHEFEIAALGGVRGPKAMAKDPKNQLFGYTGKDIKAFGEFIFDTTADKPSVTFRLINESGVVVEKYTYLQEIL